MILTIAAECSMALTFTSVTEYPTLSQK